MWFFLTSVEEAIEHWKIECAADVEQFLSYGERTDSTKKEANGQVTFVYVENEDSDRNGAAEQLNSVDRNEWSSAFFLRDILSGCVRCGKRRSPGPANQGARRKKLHLRLWSVLLVLPRVGRPGAQSANQENGRDVRCTM